MLKQMRYFQAVVRLGSFSAAADECFISQSAISQQIQTLERDLGVLLIKRNNRKLSLTPAGEYFYKKSLLITSDLDKLCRETVRISNDGGNTLKVCYLKSYAGREFRQAVERFSDTYPDVVLDISNGTHEEAYNMLRLGGADLIFNDQRRAFSDEYENLLLSETPCYIEISARNPISKKQSVNTEELKDTPCILVSSKSRLDNDQIYYREIFGIVSEFVFADNLDEARLMVAAGRGFIPIDGGELSQRFSDNISLVPLERSGKPIKIKYGAFWKTNNTKQCIKDFADILKIQFEK